MFFPSAVCNRCATCRASRECNRCNEKQILSGNAVFRMSNFAAVIFNLLNTAPTLLGRPDAVLVQLVVQRAAGEAHTPGRFGLRSVRVRKHT